MAVYELLERVSMRWYKLWGYTLIEKVMNSIPFVNGTEVKKVA